MAKIVQDLRELKQPSLPVESADEALEILEKLRKVLTSSETGVGLAAIQIGIPRQVGLIRHKGEELFLINPTVVSEEEPIIYPHEGCLSLPKTFIDTKRYRDFVIDNHIIEDGKLVPEQQYFYFSHDKTESGNAGIVAIAVQHEMDHFDGRVILDRQAPKAAPIRRDVKVGRNGPCPCGSGKKYKKCCG